ncbi:porin family protein [Sphingomonas ginkgonis]|uniref:Porin family protein n=1 Tax=Sphingomonas ginkgonis TaxID=2315330 RepID=A0A429VB07_9SPHN|nr:outer membrane beta-barrel protein [Sphingomonas ginkgonis]RST31183.1 porin family protein [Sphingomonas ginkgonis]
MNKFVALAAVAATTAIAAPAAAQGGPTGPVGAHVEAVLGVDHVRLELDDLGLGGHVGDEGILYGLGAGFDFAATSRVSLGVDVEATDSTLKASDSTASIRASRDLYAGGRVSLAVASRTNLYLKAGYSNARFTGRDGNLRASTTLDGLRLGGGVQGSLGGKAFVGLEYRYTNYQSDVTRHQGALLIGTRF